MNAVSLGDDEIRAILDSYGANLNIPIDSNTRPLLLRKIAQLTGSTSGAKKEEPDSPVEKTPEPVGAPTPTATDDGFYVLSSTEFDPDNMQIYLSKADALKAVKQVSGARFKKFDTQDGARAFKWGEEEDGAEVKSNPERPNTYPSLKTPDLSAFRKLIEETNDLERWVTAVWQNPYYLITQGDTPAILKPSTRYNALHCAVKSGSIIFCKKLFEILEGDEFWRLVYPFDSDRIRDRRRQHLLDLYLNTCDKAVDETPLHFASKYGHEDIVAYLLSFHTIVDTNRVNKYGQTPCDIACSNDRDASLSKKQRIRDLFTAPAVFYVPVLRAIDNSICPSLSAPCTLEQLKTQPPSDSKDSPIRSSAMAGPMSLRQAKSFHKEWHFPSRSSERKEVKNVKRSDPDKGMERRGRHLAHQQRIPWKEHWDFLECSCDLSTPGGLGILESYLSKLSLAPDKDQSSPTSIGDHLPPPVSPTQDHPMDESDDLLVDMSKLSLQDSAYFITPKSSAVKKHTFITGSEPTKLDYDVLLAIKDCNIDRALYPNIVGWQALIRSYSEDEQKTWRTPTKHQLNHRPSYTFQSQQHPLSSLLYSSPKLDKLTNASGDHPLAKQLFPSPSGTSKHHHYL